MNKRRDKIRSGLTRRTDDGSDQNLDDMYTEGGDLSEILSGIDQTRSNVSNAMIPSDDGNLVYRGYQLTAVGIETLSGMTVDQWQELGAILAHLESGIQWLIGDWLAYGEGKSAEWGEKYVAAMAATGLAYATCAKYKTIAGKVQFFLRRKELTFSHHELVAALPPDQQQYWLDKAVNDSLTVAKLRNAIQGATGSNGRLSIIQRSAATLTQQRNRIRRAAVRGNREAWLRHLDAEIEALRQLYQEIQNFDSE